VDIDNNLSDATGVPDNINPRECRQDNLSVNVLYPPGSKTGFDVTQDDARY
jgi:hypothetical protein